MTNLKIYSHEITEANGPGKRICLWFAGCGLKCFGCINETVNDAKGDIMTVDEVLAIIKQAQTDRGITGVSFSGGEPLGQKLALTELLERIKTETSLTILLFTGLTYREITGMRNQDFLAYVDVILAGRFNPNKWSYDNPLAHKEIITRTKAYTKRDIKAAFEIGTEISIDMETGSAIVTGVGSVDITECL